MHRYKNNSVFPKKMKDVVSKVKIFQNNRYLVEIFQELLPKLSLDLGRTLDHGFTMQSLW